MDPSIPADLPLSELSRRIASQQAELEALRHAYESTQTKLATLILRRQKLQHDLKLLNIEIETLLGGIGAPPPVPVREEPQLRVPPPAQEPEPPEAMLPPAAKPTVPPEEEDVEEPSLEDRHDPAEAAENNDSEMTQQFKPASLPAVEPTNGHAAPGRPIGMGWRITDNLDFQFDMDDAHDEHAANGSSGNNGNAAKSPSPVGRGTETGR
jgi:hypothetical protein